VARKIKRFTEAMALIARIPDGAHFDTLGESGLQFQCPTQDEARAVRKCFPGTMWRKQWVSGCNWWKYSSEYNGFKLEIYAVTESPAKCTAIYEEKDVVERVPDGYRNQVVRKKVIVGWNCGSWKNHD